MPIYEYVCAKCGKQLEILQKFSDKPKTVCPVCKGELKKLISNSSFVLKGSGWYATDYSALKKMEYNKPGIKKADTETTYNSTESESPSKSESQTESKAESKAESKKEEAAAK
jgi:putative FmdB family regulatory protein